MLRVATLKNPARPFGSCALAVLLSVVGLPSLAVAQPADLPIAPATTSEFPPGVKVAKLPGGAVYTDAKGRTLYGMDMRTLLRWSPNPALHCTAACAESWEPMLAPAGSKPNIAYPTGNRAALPEGMVRPERAPDWTIIDGAQGPQWVYKGWHMVFTRKGDQPGSTEFEGAEDMVWNTLKFVPPAPKPEAPGNVSTVLHDGAYAFADTNGRLLFSGTCQSDCGQWAPLSAGLASRGLGDWTVSRSGPQPQWLYRGKPVFISQEAEAAGVPAGAEILRP